MHSDAAFVSLFILITNGVFDVKTDEVKSVSVLEGDSVTLHTDVKVQRDDQILWTFGPQNTRIAEIIKRDQINFIFVSNDGRFRDNLLMDNQTGSLTIRNIRSDHTGLYELTVISGKTSLKSFSVTVYAPLSTPVITSNSSNCSSSSERSSVSKCSLLCSAVNVEYQEKNTYSCVLNNPISNQTRHLDISQLCHTCAEHHRSYSIPVVVGVLLFVAIIAVLGGILLWHIRNCEQTAQTVENEDIHYATATFIAHPLHHTKPNGEDSIVYSSVAAPKKHNLQYL
ncbi:SLAM family member 5-like isoform X2 [Sinocyclocheilus anshuiensis]|uniref:SLAM family member 5-like isoform X2 n=1 Tax=Sinocyclocheilus anshuiensis TaxID=1608454 RepID=UPI0007B92D3C|nr:PREDICTED: SLAM family member 5-like isoform X2 [Sinocyclocheilus anshuiensis]